MYPVAPVRKIRIGGVYHSSLVARDTLLDFFCDLARAHGDFLIYDDGFRSWSYTYEEVGRAARGFAARLYDFGIRKGDKVVLCAENRPEWIVTFWGCLLAGGIVVPIDYRASPDFLARVSKIVSAKLILIGEDAPPVRDPVEAETWRMYEIGWRDGTPPAVTTDRDDIAEIIFTSGATAEPKGVVITHRNVLANIVPVEREIIKYRKWGRPFLPLRFLNLLPLSHMFGQAMATFIPPMVPGVVVFVRGYNPVTIIDQIKRRRVSVLVSVPKILELLREHVSRVTRVDGAREPQRHFIWRWWRFRGVHGLFGLKFWAFVVGAAPLDAEVEAFWSELGFVVVQGYGLTETAPIVTLNHPFETKKGSVGKPIAGVDLKIEPDGEILVRGENVTRGYFNASDDTASAFEDGWFHTGDIGEIGQDGQLYIRGRKKEMIVTPEGLNVFPADVEKALAQVPGVRDSAVIGLPIGSEERVHAVLVLEPGADADAIVRQANLTLGDHQKIRRALVWPQADLPRTEGTGKLKRGLIREWAKQGCTSPAPAGASSDPLTGLLAKYAGRANLSSQTTLDELGLTSLDRVELMVALEDTFHTPIDEHAFSAARDLGALRSLVEGPRSEASVVTEPVNFPAWNRTPFARLVRRTSLPVLLLPLTRLFARIHVEGRDHLRTVHHPVIFAANHQTHMDVPVILSALPPRLRYGVAPAMAKEFFKAHFFRSEYGWRAWLTNSLNYYLAALFFNAFPLPQREAGARQTLRYIGDIVDDHLSVLIFPEGEMTDAGEIDPFRPGIGMIASRLRVPVVPVRIEGLERVLHKTWKMARPGRVRVAFGEPLSLVGEDYEALAGQVEQAVRRL
jgi:long-chain acyl-CoA synthetase